MKKVYLAILSFILIFSLASCRDRVPAGAGDTAEPQSSEQISKTSGEEETEIVSNTDEKVTAEKGGEVTERDTSESPKGGSDKGKGESSDPEGVGSDTELPQKPEVPVTTNPSSQKGGAKDLPKSPGNGPTVPLI